jgi:hypothetical protein
MRDSYAGYTGSSNFLSRYIPEHFSKTVLIHWYNMEYFKEYIDLYRPDVVVLEVAEHLLPDFADTMTNSWAK